MESKTYTESVAASLKLAKEAGEKLSELLEKNEASLNGPEADNDGELKSRIAERIELGETMLGLALNAMTQLNGAYDYRRVAAQSETAVVPQEQVKE